MRLVPKMHAEHVFHVVDGHAAAHHQPAVRLAHHNGEWIAHPTFQEGDDSTFEIVVAGRQLDDGDVAIMMVEAGGTEGSWELYEAGAPKVTEEVIAEGLEASKQWISAAIDLQLALKADFILARGPIEPAWFAWDDPLPFVSMAVRLFGPLTRGAAQSPQRPSQIAACTSRVSGTYAFFASSRA